MNEIETAMRTGRFVDGVELCHKELMAHPTDPKLYACEGMCYFRLGDYAHAEDCFRRATALEPQYVDAGVKRAQCLDRMHRYDEALEVAQEFRRLRPSDPALCAIVEAHQYRPNPRRTEGWEVFAQGQCRAHFASEM